MIIKTAELSDICNKISSAIDAQGLSTLSDIIEMKTEGTFFYMCVTNKEYYVQIRTDIEEETEFHATIKAGTFLRLIQQTTTETVKLVATDTNLKVIGNGEYKFPLVFSDDGKELLELPPIEIDNVTNDFNINSVVLSSIYKYNSEELNKGVAAKPVQKMFYVDDQGALTYTTGACVNNFTLAEPIKLLLNERLVKLFKLFKEEDVHFTCGYEAISGEVSLVKVKFETPNVLISSVLNCSTEVMIKSVPVQKIRERANKKYENVVYLNKNELTSTIGRLSLFLQETRPYGVFEFDEDCVTIYDAKKENKEILYYSKKSTVVEPYSLNLDLNNFRITLKLADDVVELHFGDRQAVIMANGSIRNVIPEIKYSNQ